MAERFAIRLVTHPDGSIEPINKWLCTSPIHYWAILADVVSHRFFEYREPLASVQATLIQRGF